MTSTTKKRLLDYIGQCLQTFENDPASSLFQRGYETAMREMLTVAANAPDESVPLPPSTAQACSSGAPPWARLTWHDANYIYMEFPMANSAPYIMKFSTCEGGLTSALNIMKRLYQDCDVQAKEMYRKPSGGYTIKRSKKDIKSPPTPATEAQASAVRDILRKGGYIK